MASPKDVLVLTTSGDGLKIKKYIKPVSAHIVAGTNFFSDFFASFSDVFGGRSGTYQKQLTSLYSEAIERIKFAAYELGANCIVGLSIDMDEISGKGKSMFMLAAVGTAVVLESETVEKRPTVVSNEKFENVGLDRINALRNKNAIIEKANAGSLVLNDEIWSFISTNQVDEVYPFVLKKFSEAISLEQINAEAFSNFYKQFVGYMDSLPESKRIELLYNNMCNEESEQVALKLSKVIQELNLFDYNKIMQLFNNNNFKVKKRGLRVATFDKLFYNEQDKKDLQTIREYIVNNFGERGSKKLKKQLLSKEKEIWECECGKSNDIGEYCSGCSQDIYGFKASEFKPAAVDSYIKQKIELISEYLN